MGLLLLRIALLSTVFLLSQQQPPLDTGEQEAVYEVLNSLNPTIPWRTLFPDDLCLSAPHGVVCDWDTTQQIAHVVELSFGYVSDETPNPPCSLNATLNPLLFTSFNYLRKLFFYKCFNHTTTPLSLVSLLPSFPPTLEELVFIDNPSLVAPFTHLLSNLTSLRRLVLIGNGFHGEVPRHIGGLVNLEEVTLSRNHLGGEVSPSLAMLKNLKVLDLSENEFEGCVPESLGNLTELLKLDMSYNGFGCKIPESLRNLQKLEFLDLSFNSFGNFGVPLFLGEIPRLKEVYLSGNSLSGKIPEIWENLGGVIKMGFSDMGLVGNIPASMGVYLRNLSYLGLDNNMLEGPVPEEFALLEFADEINLENNNLSGRIPFSNKVGGKLKLGGNRGLCVDNKFRCIQNGGILGQLKPCKKADVPDAVLFNGVSLMLFDPLMLVMSLGLLFVFTGF
ncbi:piriformospora indica-insensitive protein 2-like [Gastrolobium bilobum]|uniref:piriformospora indica-insensitive protein 2-like n=1 Tax=Gastrolobium bilobum TaxID=150636 RepID=UPI002AAFFBE1|nr:piriformospora indica-insensitive protein 2-like [Gastrolobium bilobum]